MKARGEMSEIGRLGIEMAWTRINKDQKYTRAMKLEITKEMEETRGKGS